MKPIRSAQLKRPRAPACRKTGDHRERKTLGGYVKCRRLDCPPFEKGEENCFCCNGPDEFPVNGQWSEWSQWKNDCETSNNQNRYRICNNPAPLRNGDVCSTKLGNRSHYERDSVQCMPGAVFYAPWIMALCWVLLVIAMLAILLLGWIFVKNYRNIYILPRIFHSTDSESSLPVEELNEKNGDVIMQNQNPRDSIVENNVPEEGVGLSAVVMAVRDTDIQSTVRLSSQMSTVSQTDSSQTGNPTDR